MNGHWKRRALLASVLSASPIACAQSAASPPETLANLGDKRLMSELADRGLDSLLDRYFDLHKTPEAEQKAIRSMEGLRDLSNPKIAYAEKQRTVQKIVDGINSTLPNINDPFRLTDDAGLLLLYGVTRDANILEYWGDNPATAARLRPTAQAVYDMLGKASKEATDQAAALALRINAQNQNTLGTQWDKLDHLSNEAAYSQAMEAYDLALALPKDQRAKVVDRGMKYLEDLDNADSGVMSRVHLMMGKLNLVAGKNDDALTFLNAVANKDKSIQPPPEPAQVYEAKYFANVAELDAGKMDEAKEGLDRLVSWEKTALPGDAATQNGVAAAAEMLRYRIDLAEAAHAQDPEAKKTAHDNAVNVLLKLSESRPDLRSIIYQQLVEQLPKNAPVKEMDPLLLQGVMAKAYTEANKPEGVAIDQNIIQRGLAAAREIVARNVGPVLTAQMKNDAAKLIPVLREASGDKIGAAQAYLHYAQENVNLHRTDAEAALEDAGRLTFGLRRSDPQDPRVSDLYDAFLPVAINPPFNRVEWAYYYAQRLTERNPREAIKYFGIVPRSDRNFNNARYFSLKAMQNLLDQPNLPEEQRNLDATDLVHEAEVVRGIYGHAADTVGRERAAIAAQIEAETYGSDLKNPSKSLQLLTGYEQTIKGIPDEKRLLIQTLLDRVKDDVALGQLSQATDVLVALLKESGGAEGAEYVHELLTKLDGDLDKARAAGDHNAMSSIVNSEAALSGFLVQWASTNSNPEIRKSTYRYKIFDAHTQLLAAELTTDPAKKQAQLNRAMAAYTALQQPANLVLYKATLDQRKIASGDINPDDPDPNVMLGIGLVDFERKDDKDAAQILGGLLNAGKLGAATLDLRPDGTAPPNDLYWEATYKLYASNLGAAKGPADPVLNPTKQGLKNLLIRGVPPKWQGDFESLRHEMIPNFSVAALSESAAPPPATKPAAPPRVRRAS